MIEKMKFLSITGPKADIDRVVNQYLAKYEIHLENAMAQLNQVQNLSPFIQINPYKEVLAKAEEFTGLLGEEKQLKLRDISLEEATELIDRLGSELSEINVKCEEENKKRTKIVEDLNLVSPFLKLPGDIDQLVHYRFVQARFGRIAREYYEKFKAYVYDSLDTWFYPCHEDEYVWGVYFVPWTRMEEVDAVFSSLHFERIYLKKDYYYGTPQEIYDKLRVELNAVDKKIAEYPFPRITYKEAMLKYGSDKPDLRNPLRIVDVTDFFQRCTFKPFHGQTVRAIKVSNKMSKGFHEKLLKFATSIGMGGLGYLEVKEDLSYKGPIDKFIPDDMKAEIREIASLKAGDTIFFIADKEKQAALYAGQLRNELGQRLDLLEKNAYRFCFINDFPMYEYDEEQKKIIFTHNPFSMPQGGLEALTTKDPLELLAYQYDIVCNGVELSSGAVRNHNLDIMVKAFEIAGYTEEDLKEKFGALYNAFQYGAPPHAGMAPGVDRMIMLLRNEENIREVIPFPMNGNAQDVMCGAPNEVSEMQLREVHIKVRK